MKSSDRTKRASKLHNQGALLRAATSAIIKTPSKETSAGYDSEAQSQRARHGARFQYVTSEILRQLLQHHGLHVVLLPSSKTRRNPFSSVVEDQTIAANLLDRLSLPLRRPCDQQRVDTFPDSDMVVLSKAAGSNWRVLAVISCKTTLRERHTQACFWGLAFKNHTDINYFLVTQDAKGIGKACIGGNETRRRLETCTSGVFLINDWSEKSDAELQTAIDDMITRSRTNPGALLEPVFDIAPSPVEYCSAVHPFSRLLPTLVRLHRKWIGAD